MEQVNNREEHPSLHGESEIVHEYHKMDTEVLQNKLQRFIEALNDPTTLPDHKKQYARLIDHIAFEFSCRDAETSHLESMLGGNALEAMGVEDPAL